MHSDLDSIVHYQAFIDDFWPAFTYSLHLGFLAGNAHDACSHLNKVRLYICIHVCVCVCVCINLRMYMCVCIYMYMCVCAHLYI
jgi:hypothetical protein